MTMDSPTEARSATAPISELSGCSGLELVARLADGSIRRPPMAETLPFTLLPPEEGKVGHWPLFCNQRKVTHFRNSLNCQITADRWPEGAAAPPPARMGEDGGAEAERGVIRSTAHNRTMDKLGFESAAYV